MSLADPAVLTVNGAAKSLVRVRSDEYSSEYRLKTSVDEYKLSVRNTSYKDKQANVMRDRHNIEFIHTVYPVAPATLATTRKVYAVIENQLGDTLADPIYVASALLTFMTSSSNANLTKMLNFES